MLCCAIGYAVTASERVDSALRATERDAQRSGAAEVMPEPGGRWLVRLTTSGGIGGSYLELTVGANGDLSARASTGSVHCTAHVSDAVTQRLDAALTKSRPDRWAPAYIQPSNPNGCCDQFRDLVHVEWTDAKGQRTTRETYWFSDSARLVPPEITSLSNEIYQARTVCAVSH
jgi:hypothetical protein